MIKRQPFSGTLINLPVVDPYDLPRRYRSTYDRDDYKRPDYARADYSTPDYSRQDSATDRYKSAYSSTERATDYSSERHRDRTYSVDKKEDRYRTSAARVETKKEDDHASIDVALRRSPAVAEASFEMVVLKKELTAVDFSVREVRKTRRATTVRVITEKIHEEREVEKQCEEAQEQKVEEATVGSSYSAKEILPTVATSCTEDVATAFAMTVPSSTESTLQEDKDDVVSVVQAEVAAKTDDVGILEAEVAAKVSVKISKT